HLPRGRPGDDEATRRRHRQRLERRRRPRQPGPDELLGVEGRDHRLHEGARAGARRPRGARERRRAGLRRDAAHRRPPRAGARADAREYAARTPWPAGRHRRSGTLPLLGRGLVHHGRSPTGRRRPGNLSSNGRRRVVITGLGAVTPLGKNAETTWENLVAGKSGAGDITHFDASEYAVTFA